MKLATESSGITKEQMYELSEKYQIDWRDILMILLNCSGVRSEFTFPRMRFRMSLKDSPKELFFMIVALGREKSPFYLTKDTIFFNDEPVIDVFDLENDDIVTSYFRNDNSVLTINSNARSQCKGCIFCYNYLEKASDRRFDIFDNLSDYAKNLVNVHGKNDASFIKKVTVCTACFNSERRAIDHLKLVKNAFVNHGFCGTIHYIGSMICSEEGFNEVIEELSPFELTFTIECFNNRKAILKNSKSKFTIDKIEEVFLLARKKNIDVNFTYLVGLDDYDSMIMGLKRFAPLVSKLPLFNCYQPHTNAMDDILDNQANDIEFYLKSRRDIEDIFSPMGFKAKSWECYRSLWYFSFDKKPLICVRI